MAINQQSLKNEYCWYSIKRLTVLLKTAGNHVFMGGLGDDFLNANNGNSLLIAESNNFILAFDDNGTVRSGLEDDAEESLPQLLSPKKPAIAASDK